MNSSNMTQLHNYHNFFTYESIIPGDETGNLSYVNCTMLKDVGNMKKDMKLEFIDISYNFYGWFPGKNGIGDPDFNEVTCDYSTQQNDDDQNLNEKNL